MVRMCWCPSCVCVGESYHGNESSDEAEVGEVVGVDGGGRVDLQTIVVLAGVLEQAVHGVEHLVGEQEEPLSVGEGERRPSEPREGREEERRFLVGVDH